MTLKGMLVRLFLLAAGFMCALFVQYTLDRNVNNIAERLAPQYVPLTEEEVYMQANLPCIRPAGASVGCTRPVIQKPSSVDPVADGTWDSYVRLRVAQVDQKLYDLDQQRLDTSLALPEAKHRSEFRQKEIEPRIDNLTMAFKIGFSLLYAGIVLYTILVMWKWYATQGRLAIGQGMGKLNEVAALKGMAANRKLRQAENDFSTLKNLYENGLITEEMFLQRKDQLKSILGSNEVFRKEETERPT